MGKRVRLIRYRYQRTLARPAEVSGIGFLTGANVCLRFCPAPASTGVVFARTDLRPPARIRAHVDYVTGTTRRTTLGQPPGQVALVEHVLAALAGLRIDNCLVELNAPEPPGLDGSARCFVKVLRQAGCRLQPARRCVYTVCTPIIVSQHGATLAIHPTTNDSLKVSYILNYGQTAPIVPQISTCMIRPDSFANDVSSCRTFLLYAEAAELRRQGLGARTTAADLLVFGRNGPIDNSLRYGNEPARHKILDVVGDLSLLGHDLVGHVVAYRSGHPLNVELVRRLTEQLGRAQIPLQEIAA
jgi:UDP-3-O-acyl N-acetylglucosamine deacetylase